MADAAQAHDHMLARCIKMGGAYPAGVLLFRMHFWSRLAKIEKNGHKWMVNSASWWAEEACASPKQLRTAWDELRKRGLILTEKHLFRNKTHAFVRLTGKAMEGITCSSIEGITGKAPEGVTYKKGDLEGSIEKDLVETSLDEASIGPEEVSGKEEGMKGLKSVKDVEAEVKAQAILHKPNSVKALEFIWKKRVTEITKAPVALKQVEFGQLSHFAKFCPPGKSETVLKAVLADWIAFIKKVELQAGVKGGPVLPNVGFLLKHAGVAVIVATPKELPPMKHEATIGVPSAKSMQVTSPTPPTPEVQKPQSLAEIWAPVDPDEAE